MNYSYWEIKEWFTNTDFTIVGSGIVGLSCALALRKKYPKAKIVILEKGLLPQGASTKNAGFACFGSLSDLVEKRWEGLHLLRKTLGDKQIDYQQNNGYELFLNSASYDACVSRKKEINQLLQPIFNTDVFSTSDNTFNFQKTYSNYSVNQFEGQIDTGKMMTQLLLLAQKKGIRILNSISVDEFIDDGQKVTVKTDRLTFKTNKLLIATNGFANQLLFDDVQPARAQVLITKPIKNLQIKGTFHIDKGYYYFRNIDNRILLGGGRNLDFKTEETVNFGITKLVQNKLEQLLKETILPNRTIEIEHRWSGIMGVGHHKKPIIKAVSNNVFCGVRHGGMGVAIGSLVGKELAELL